VKRAVLVLALLTAGCAGPYRVSVPGERVDLGLYSVDPQIHWNMASNRIWQDWTVHGYAIHELSIVNGLKDGEALYPRLQRKENAPVFRSTMAPEDVAIFIDSTLEFMGAKQLKKSPPRPQPFGLLTGGRVEVEYLDGGELEVKDLFVWVIHSQRLHLIRYRGAKEHYYAKYLDVVEKLIASIRLSR